MFEIIAATFCLYPASFIIALLIIYFAKLKFWLTKINKRIYILGPSETSFRSYRTVELVSQFGYSCLSPAIFPLFYAIAHAFSTVTFALLAKSFEGVGIEVQLNSLCALCVIIATINAVIKGAGEIVTTSQTTKAIFKNAQQKTLRRNMAACRDIRIYFNSVFFIEQGTFTVFMDSVIHNTITFLLSS